MSETENTQQHSMDLAATVKIREFLEFAPSLVKAGYPILLRGRHGIGKSEVLKALERSIDCITGLVEVRASQLVEGDMTGLPGRHEEKVGGLTVTAFDPPMWLARAAEKPVILFFDEIDRATQEIRQGLFQIGDSHKFYNTALHPQTIVVAAVNGGPSGSEYQVTEMEPAELSRWIVFDLNPDFNDWKEWAVQDNNINPLVLSFLDQNRIHLEHLGTFTPGKVYPSRRSWKRLSDILGQTVYIKKPKRHSASIQLLSAAVVGFEAAAKLGDYFRRLETNAEMTAEELFIEKQWDRVEKMAESGAINEFNALNDKIATYVTDPNGLNEILDADSAETLTRYMVQYLPPEVFMTLNKSIISGVAGTERCKEMMKIDISKYLDPESNYLEEPSESGPVRTEIKSITQYLARLAGARIGDDDGDE